MTDRKKDYSAKRLLAIDHLVFMIFLLMVIFTPPISSTTWLVAITTTTIYFIVRVAWMMTHLPKG